MQGSTCVENCGAYSPQKDCEQLLRCHAQPKCFQLHFYESYQPSSKPVEIQKHSKSLQSKYVNLAATTTTLQSHKRT